VRQPIYLGDGLYAEVGHWEGETRVYASNGVTQSNEVFLDADMIDKLHAWAHSRG
jgi:hypothetical protein